MIELEQEMTCANTWLGENLFVGHGRLTDPRAISDDIYRVL